MVADIYISANFKDAASLILAGPSEDTLKETNLQVADARNRPLNAVKMLAGKCNTALVISRLNDKKKGWLCTRKMYRRVKQLPPGAASQE